MQTIVAVYYLFCSCFYGGQTTGIVHYCKEEIEICQFFHGAPTETPGKIFGRTDLTAGRISAHFRTGSKPYICLEIAARVYLPVVCNPEALLGGSRNFPSPQSNTAPANFSAILARTHLIQDKYYCLN